MRTLKLGSQGDDVAAWQEFLTAQGFAPGKADGVFGGGTRLATIAFQSSVGLEPADGIVGLGTVKRARERGFVEPPELKVDGALGANDEFLDEIGGVPIFESEGGGAVYFTAGMTVDADGAHRAYKIRNEGLDFDDNGKNPAKPDGRWVGAVTDSKGNPIVQKADDPAPGYLISTTSLSDLTRDRTDPLRYVDSENVPYIVLPGGVLGKAKLGDYAIAVNLRTGKFIHALVADSGPKKRIGEASIAVAKALLGPDEKHWSPRGGGTEERIIRYIVFPQTWDQRFPSSHPGRPEMLTGVLAHINTRSATLFAALKPAYQMALLGHPAAAIA